MKSQIIFPVQKYDYSRYGNKLSKLTVQVIAFNKRKR